MKDWNVVISVYQDGFRHALRGLRDLGPIEPSRYHNIVVMKVDDPISVLAAIERRTEENAAFYDAPSRVAPCAHCFDFHSAGDFAGRIKSYLFERLSDLAGRSFHVRVHRRGAKRDLPAHDTERLLDDAVLEATLKIGQSSRISFNDPDVVIAIDAIDDRAGVALWTREDLARLSPVAAGLVLHLLVTRLRETEPIIDSADVSLATGCATGAA